jgi:hypothetical protein
MGTEKDPNGMSQHDLGAKLDNGKARPGLVFNSMHNALLAVAQVGTFGAVKYTDDGWLHVLNGISRYSDACDRHRLYKAEELFDKDSGLLHQAHLAWNALAELELTIRNMKDQGVNFEEKFQAALAKAQEFHRNSQVNKI